jgi:6-pyruvoyltetrahydropterin/6-carboxytetrahydropterin synthase
MGWRIDKSFSFCYGHRVWSQKLESQFCEKGDTSCKCRHLHGHEGLVHVFLEADALERGMVTDFKHLGWLKTFLDDTLDHKFIIDINDPMYNTLVVQLYEEVDSNTKRHIKLDKVFVENKLVGYEINVEGIDSTLPVYETLEGFFIVDFVPTSENLSKWLFDIVKEKMKPLGVKVSQVDWYETPKSRSSYCE